MKTVLVEFINTCPCCDGYVRDIQKAAAPYGQAVQVKIYHAGKDFDYLKKYGMVSKGTMIVGGRKKYDVLTPEIIARAIAEAVEAA